MSETIFKILEKRYDKPTEGWVLIDIVPTNPEELKFYTSEELELYGAYERGDIFGWTLKALIQAELERTNFVVTQPLMDCGDDALIRYVATQVIPMEWISGFMDDPELYSRLWVCKPACTLGHGPGQCSDPQCPTRLSLSVEW